MALARITVELDDEQLTSLNSLARLIEENEPEHRARGRLSKAATLRIAIQKANEAARKEYGEGEPVASKPVASDIEGLDDYEETPEERARIDRMYREAQEQEAREREAAGVGDE